ncbi:hypothetical protein AB835_00630 [Candidatus Endobugula sertula]|uniref:Uncharacterized protein n=1 Tax=Candidatus Endobugula sertula TaxID=62101 RepID=A0A1D2QU16_9GAMM|nr:hypothetical protein AB835_00630 [Candidatus Endobugula sertula]
MASTVRANENSTDSESNNNHVTTLGKTLPIDPFRSLYVHFGMLLGVEDFRTVDAYHRGKMWFHNAWLHRQGALWGLEVSLDAENNEVRVSAGAALDAMGHELYLQQDACLNLNAWYQQHNNDPEFEDIVQTDPDTGAKTFSAHVVIQFKACLNRQVPALTEPCDGSNATTAYSRVAETVELKLVPGLAPQWREEPGQLPFHRVRLLFGLEDAMVDGDGVVIDSDQDVLDSRTAILALPNEQQASAYLNALRHFSTFDAMELRPAAVDDGDFYSLFPSVNPNAIPLANIIDITLHPSSHGFEVDKDIVTSDAIDNTIRPVHIPTSTQQELSCGPMMPASAEPLPAPDPIAPLVDAGGPRVVADSFDIKGEWISFSVEGIPLMKASVDARAFSITSFDRRDGWISAEIKSVNYDQTTQKIDVELRDAPGGNLLRIIVKGTGPYPIMGRNRIPLAGAVDDGKSGTEFEGNDVVHMLRIKANTP